MNRIEHKFKELKRANKKAFIAFITAGYPDLHTTEELIIEFSKAGVDIIELGVPFSDPLADGPVIQEASQEALKKRAHLAGIIKLVGRVRKSVPIPLCLMTYYNPIFCFGREKFIREALRNGVDGVIIPDLPPEEDAPFVKAAAKSGLDLICFLSPTSTVGRMKFISRVSRGFIYYVSLTGVTGARKALSPDIQKNIRLIKKYTNKPICVGFGVSTYAQVKEAGRLSDGVIVGSAIVKKIKDNLGKRDLIERVVNFVRGLKHV